MFGCLKFFNLRKERKAKLLDSNKVLDCEVFSLKSKLRRIDGLNIHLMKGLGRVNTPHMVPST